MMDQQAFLQSLQSFVGEQSSQNDSFRLDFSNPKHYDFYVSCYGGEAFLQSEYPMVYQAIQNTVKKHQEGKPRQYVAPNAAQPVQVTAKEQSIADRVVSLSSSVWTYPNPSVDRLRLTGYLQSDDLQDPKVFDSTSKKFDYPREPGAEIPEKFELSLSSTAAIVKEEKRAGVVTSCILQTASAKDLTVDMLVENSTVLYVNGYSDFIESFTVEHPRSYKTKPNNPIKVMYGNRYVADKDDYGYTDIVEKDHQVATMLPIKGSIVLSEDYPPVGPSESKTLKTTLQFQGKTVATYQNPGHLITHSGNTISFTFPDDWMDPLKTEVFTSMSTALLHCQFFYKIHDPDFGDTDIGFGITSDPHAKNFYEAKESTQVFVPGIYYEWGCFAKDTLIRMADGTECPVQNLKAGDMVATYQGAPAQVRNIMSGYEEEMVCIETKNGRKLILTVTHPVLTERGLVTASQVNAADCLMMEDGSQSQIHFLYREDYRDNVYNLDMDKPYLLFANGFVSGNLQQQNEMALLPPEPLSPEGQQFLEELDQLERALGLV